MLIQVSFGQTNNWFYKKGTLYVGSFDNNFNNTVDFEFMTKRYYTLLLLLCFISCKEKKSKLIACGSDKVIIIDIEDSLVEAKIIWQWQPADAISLPLVYQENYFKKIDECKPSYDGKNIMITSSTGGIAIINKQSKDVIFYAKIGNPHSIEQLPNDIIAVAASNNKDGNCIAFYNKHNVENSPFLKDSLYGGHGLVWEKNNQLLYALGSNELRAYKLINWLSESRRVQLQEQWALPDTGGHDLVNFNQRDLLITTNNNIWRFNKTLENFEVFQPLEGVKDIKGISITENDKIAYVKAEEKWWSHHIYITNPNNKLSIPDVNLYKVRWWNFE